MTLDLRIDPDTAVPAYEQVRSAIAGRVDSGELLPGTRLPSVRALADQLGLASNTVARAYRELEHTGVVVTRGRNGTVVNGDGGDRAAKEAASRYAEVMRGLGIRQDVALELVRRAFDRPVSS